MANAPDIANGKSQVPEHQVRNLFDRQIWLGALYNISEPQFCMNYVEEVLFIQLYKSDLTVIHLSAYLID